MPKSKRIGSVSSKGPLRQVKASAGGVRQRPRSRSSARFPGVANQMTGSQKLGGSSKGVLTGKAGSPASWYTPSKGSSRPSPSRSSRTGSSARSIAAKKRSTAGRRGLAARGAAKRGISKVRRAGKALGGFGSLIK